MAVLLIVVKDLREATPGISQVGAGQLILTGPKG